MKIEGKFLTFNDMDNIGGYSDVDIEYKYYEMILPSALDNTIMDNVQLLYHHNNTILPYATTQNGSLEITKKEDGLYFMATIEDEKLLNLISSCNMGCSFGCYGLESNETSEYEEHEEKVVVRDYGVVNKIDKLIDVTITFHPAYKNTYVKEIKENVN